MTACISSREWLERDYVWLSSGFFTTSPFINREDVIFQEDFAMTIRRYFQLLTFFIALIAGVSISSAQYTYDTSLTISPNDSTTASINLSHDQYWWKITTPSDGKIVLETQVVVQPAIEVYVYDINLNQLARSVAVGNTATMTLDYLGQGTYYFKVVRKGGEGTCVFTNRFTPPSGANDTEPNGVSANAMTLTVGVNGAGHIGYYFAGDYDQQDWWTVTTATDGVLSLTALCDTTLEADIILFDKNMAEVTRFTGTSKPSLSQALISGKYYIKIQVRGGQGSYSLQSSLTMEPVPGETEPNDQRSDAISITPETTVAGHLGYYGETGKDTDDYYTFSLSTLWDNLYIRSENSSTMSVVIELMDTGGVIATAHIDGTTGYLVRSKAGSNIGKTTYYVKVSCEQGFGSYSFIISNSSSTPLKSTIQPPSNLTVSDKPNDNGHTLSLSWALSPDDLYITHYNIYRSRKSTLTTPKNLSDYKTVSALISAENSYTIFIAELPKGQSSYIDPFVPVNGVTYYYWIQAVSVFGTASKIVAADFPTTVQERGINAFAVYPPYPNPFNPSTTFRYEIPEKGHVSLVIFDILGRKVAMLQDGVMSAGIHDAIWNGKDERGFTVSSGTYLYQVRAAGRVLGGKVMFLR